MFPKDSGDGSAGVHREASPAPTQRRARRLNVTFAKALMAAGTLNQVAAGVSAGVLRSRPGDQGGRVDAGIALGTLLGAHSRSTPDPSAVPAPASRFEVGPGGASLSPPQPQAAGRAASGHQVRTPASRAV